MTSTADTWVWRRGEHYQGIAYLLFEDTDTGHWAYAFALDEVLLSPTYLNEAEARSVAHLAIDLLLSPTPPRGPYEH